LDRAQMVHAQDGTKHTRCDQPERRPWPGGCPHPRRIMATGTDRVANRRATAMAWRLRSAQSRRHPAKAYSPSLMPSVSPRGGHTDRRLLRVPKARCRNTAA
jgi:hypothetical protein